MRVQIVAYLSRSVTRTVEPRALLERNRYVGRTDDAILRPSDGIKDDMIPLHRRVNPRVTAIRNGVSLARFQTVYRARPDSSHLMSRP